MPNVLMACTHPYWSALQVGSQHLARQFARHGWDVVYLSAPVTPLHLPRLASPEVRARFRSAFATPSIHENGRIQAFTPFSLIAPDGRPILREPLVTRHWYRTMIPSIQRILAKSGASRVDMLYIDNLSNHFLLSHIPHGTSVFRVMDMHERFPGWKGRAKQLAEKIAGRAELTAYSARGLKPYVDSLEPRQAMFLPNGVDADFFSTSSSPAQKRHRLLKDIPDPVVLYTGMIDTRLDFELICTVATQLPHVSFVFAGPLRKRLHLPKLPENVIFIGPVGHGALPQLMHSAQAGIIPFDVTNRLDLIQGIRPLKLLEYMAAGLPVICARWPEVESMDSPARLYDSGQECAEFIGRAVAEGFDPEESRSFARRQDWRVVFDLLVASLQRPQASS